MSDPERPWISKHRQSALTHGLHRPLQSAALTRDSFLAHSVKNSTTRQSTRTLCDPLNFKRGIELKRACASSRNNGGVIMYQRILVPIDGSAAAEHRSEERRVGKECRSRWS